MILPKSLKQIADIIGKEDALKLHAATISEGRIYIPVIPMRPTHPIVKAVGEALAEKLRFHLGGAIFRFSPMVRDRLILHGSIANDWMLGNPIKDIAAKHDVTKRTVFNVIGNVSELDIAIISDTLPAWLPKPKAGQGDLGAASGHITDGKMHPPHPPGIGSSGTPLMRVELRCA